jgi:phospholipase C
MLENRAFDHMLGFSGITGTDAVSGRPTSLIGLSGNELNSWNGETGKVSEPADEVMAVDPGHEFADVLCQLSGTDATYLPGASYPPINNSGFMASYAKACTKSGLQRDPAEILKCFSPAQLPVLNTLAREFAVCDNWYASMPGPTWPNRLFVHGASSGGLDHSPTVAEIARWELTGFELLNGHIFDRIAAAGLTRRLYGGDLFPMIGALKGIHLDDIRQFEHFAADLQATFDYNYVFIEPSYNLAQDYRGSSSQHPLGDVRLGENLIKSTYEAIRNSSVWPNSLLIITWDEHGGFFDHVVPWPAVAPGDTSPGGGHNTHGFTFQQYGPRVPAVIISPLIPKNTIDHGLYDHTSIPATIEQLFALAPLTNRDRAANTVLPLLALAAPRNTPAFLPFPTPPLVVPAAAPMAFAPSLTARPHDSVNDGNLPVVIQAAMRQEIELSPPGERGDIIARVAGLKTRADAANYLNQVVAKRQAKPAPGFR